MMCPRCGSPVVPHGLRRALACVGCGLSVSELERQRDYTALTLTQAFEEKCKRAELIAEARGVTTAKQAETGRVGR